LTAGWQHALALWWQQVEQPVVIRMPAAKTAARIIIVFMLVGLFVSWLVFSTRKALRVERNITPFIRTATSSIQGWTVFCPKPRDRHKK
jgi:hypothetical protein